MDKQTTYLNRYRDKIVFTHEGDTVVMTGYNPEWLGCSYENDYDEAYLSYINDLGGVFDPIDFLPYCYKEGKKIPVIPKAQFIRYLFEYDSELKEYKCPKKYRVLVKTTSIINNVDPSGGPYISVGDNLNEFFNDGVKRVIESIEIQPGKTVFKIK